MKTNAKVRTKTQWKNLVPLLWGNEEKDARSKSYGPHSRTIGRIPKISK